MLVEECESGEGLNAKCSAHVHGTHMKAALQKKPIYNYKANY